MTPPCPLCKSTDTVTMREHNSATGKDSLLNYCNECACCAPPSTWVQYQTQALSQPKDVKRPEFWSEERLRDFEQNVIDADKLTPQIRALQAYIEQQDAEIADIIEEKDGYKFSAKAFEGAFEECRLNLSALEQPTAQGWREVAIQLLENRYGQNWPTIIEVFGPDNYAVQQAKTLFIPTPPRSEVSNG